MSSHTATRQASALMRMAVAESRLSEETAARELAEARLRKCDGFFADLGDRLERSTVPRARPRRRAQRCAQVAG